MNTNIQNSQGSTNFLSDLNAGFLVFLIALPLSLGISIASGFPPVAGILTAIIGGLVASFLGSSRLTIKGPAAGLIVIALGAVQELGMGDPVSGYKRALAVGVVAAVVQIFFSFFGAATLGVAMSPSVVHGMLAAIGVIIVSKQAHVLLGVSPHAKEPLELLLEIPQSLIHANPEILLIGAISLLLLFGLPRLPLKGIKKLPAPLLVLVVAIPLGYYFGLSNTHEYSFLESAHTIGPDYLIQLPASLLDAIVFPDFSVIFSVTSIKYIVLFALIGSVESVLSVIAVDSMDPQKKVSNLNKDLFAVGAGNLLCAAVGGLPMISEIVRSKANVDSGATSYRANIVHGACLLLFVSLFPGLLSQIPLAALAAMLIYTGLRLASPSVFKHAKAVGNDQLLLFLTTFVVTLAIDLLVGVTVGIALKLFLHWKRGVPLKALFIPTIQKEVEGEVMVISVEGPAVFTNLLHIRKLVLHAEKNINKIILNMEKVELVDHTFLTRINELLSELKDQELELKGLDELIAASNHPCATRVRRN